MDCNKDYSEVSNKTEIQEEELDEGQELKHIQRFKVLHIPNIFQNFKLLLFSR